MTKYLKKLKDISITLVAKVKKLPHNQQQIILAVALLAVGIAAIVMLVKLKKPPAKKRVEVLAPLVKVKKMEVRDIQMNVSSYGTVRAKMQIEIVPQVPGKVVEINANFDSGGFIKADEALLKIDPRDYELLVEQSQAAVAEAQVRLDLEKAEAQVARKEWKQIHPDSEPESALVFREPQIRQAQAQLKSARARLAKANLNLERTKLSLPVDAYIASKKVDLGQYVMTGQSVGSAYGIELFEIELPLEDRDLAWFDIPQNANNRKTVSTKAATAKIRSNFAGNNNMWTGYVRRTVGQVDPTSRLISVVIEIPEPFEGIDGKQILLPGAFVEVTIKGRILKGAISLPRSAVHDGTDVWVVKDDRVYIRPLQIVRTDKDFAYVTSGLEDGDLIVTSSLDAVTERMKVRTEFANTSKNKEKGVQSQPGEAE